MATTFMNTADAKEEFADLINRVSNGKDRVILTRRGKEVAVVIPIDDLQLLQESQDKHDVREAIDALKEVRHIGAVTWEVFKEESGT